MPTTLTAVLVLAVAIVPGFLAELLFSRLRGTDWRERESRAVLRMLSFSVGGLLLYASLAALAGLPEALHVLPEMYGTRDLGRFVEPYVGHILASLALALGTHAVLRGFEHARLLSFRTVGVGSLRPRRDVAALGGEPATVTVRQPISPSAPPTQSPVI